MVIEAFLAMDSKRSIMGSLWKFSGEEGARLLYRGIGVILSVAGCALLIWARGTD